MFIDDSNQKNNDGDGLPKHLGGGVRLDRQGGDDKDDKKKAKKGCC